MTFAKLGAKSLGFLFLLGALSYGATLPALAQAAPSHAIAPNFTRMDLTHKKIELSGYRGKVVLLNFWATWCGPCLTEMPMFTEWQQQYGADRFQVIGISMDDAAPEVIATVSKLKLNYPILMGDEKIGAAYGDVLGLPVTFLIDRHGKIRARYDGVVDHTRIKEEIQALLRPQ
jgi:cytochrome c biogenesis protein CcmG, thiol:disulfide interchange protein DsbE